MTDVVQLKKPKSQSVVPGWEVDKRPIEQFVTYAQYVASGVAR